MLTLIIISLFCLDTHTYKSLWVMMTTNKRKMLKAFYVKPQ